MYKINSLPFHRKVTKYPIADDNAKSNQFLENWICVDLLYLLISEIGVFEADVSKRKYLSPNTYMYITKKNTLEIQMYP